MTFKKAGHTLMGLLTLTLLFTGLGDAKAEFSIPDSASALVGMASLSGEDQGAAMDGAKKSGTGSMTALSHDACEYYYGNDWYACQYGLQGGSCVWYYYSEYDACMYGQETYYYYNPPTPVIVVGGGGGGATDPLFALLAVAFGLALGVSKMRSGKSAGAVLALLLSVNSAWAASFGSEFDGAFKGELQKSFSDILSGKSKDVPATVVGEKTLRSNHPNYYWSDWNYVFQTANNIERQAWQLHNDGVNLLRYGGYDGWDQAALNALWNLSDAARRFRSALQSPYGGAGPNYSRGDFENLLRSYQQADDRMHPSRRLGQLNFQLRGLGGVIGDLSRFYGSYRPQPQPLPRPPLPHPRPHPRPIPRPGPRPWPHR